MNTESTASAAGFMSTGHDLERLLQQQRTAFMKEGEVLYATRIDRLDRCIALLADHSDKLCKAMDQDFNGRSRHLSLMSEIITSLGSLKFAKKHIKKWMKPERRSAGIPMNLLGARASVHYQPKGVVGIMTPWNFPVNMVFSPLADVLAAGNRAMIKPSETNPATAALLAELMQNYFEETEIAVCCGGPETGAAFSTLPLDHLIFTGGTAIGRKVMQSAAANLTPVTLELGGKSPVIIGVSANMAEAAERIISGKSMNVGQACVSPDYVFVPEGHVEGFVRNCRETFIRMFPKITANPDYSSIINQHHYERLQSYVEDARQQGARIEDCTPGSEPAADDKQQKLPLQLVLEPAADALIMQNEIFGPLLVIRSYRSLEDALAFINARPRPLALYYFGRDREEEQKVLAHTRSGGVTINDVMMHVGCDDLPFGGIGASGLGNYRGKDGFRTFSHARAVFRQGFASPAKLFNMLPPYGEKTEKVLSGQIQK